MDRRIFWGGLVIVIGIVSLLQAAGIIGGNIWAYFWALLLIVVGLGILFPER